MNAVGGGKGTVQMRWDEMHTDKGDLIQRCEQYARWTIPGIMPEDNSSTQAHELLKSFVVIGPRLVNNLSNKIVEVMFPQSRPFFTVGLSADVKQLIRQEAGDDALNESAGDVRAEARWLEELCMSKINLVKYRPVAVDAVQQIIVTGNTCLRRLPDNSRVAYSVRDFSVKRNMQGEVIEACLRDKISLYDLSAEDQEKVISMGTVQHDKKDYYKKNWLLYTYFCRKGASWEQVQEVAGVSVGKTTKYTPVNLPITVLTWSLRRGEDYGRGLVEEHRVVFHNLDRTGEALFDLFEIAAEIKFLVKPGMVDVVELNRSRRGSYHAGNPDDVTTLQVTKYNDLQVIMNAVEGMERELSYVFLSGAGTTRDAERVTALEIQYSAMELETAFGGLYSRLALDWQQREADYLVQNTAKKISIGGRQMFDVVITTGLESLSREGELENFRRAVADLAMLKDVPENVQSAMNPLKLAAFIFAQRGVKFGEFLYTKAEQAAMQAQQQQELQQEANLGVQTEAAKVAAKSV